MGKDRKTLLFALRTASCTAIASCMLLGATVGAYAQDMTDMSDTATESSDTAQAESTASTVGVVCLAANIKEGGRVNAEDLVIKEVKSALAPSNAITDMAAVVGKYATMNLFEGEYIYEEQISETRNQTSDKTSSDRVGEKYLNVADYIKPNTGVDVYKALDTLIKNNPRRTFYFADGEYIISQPLKITASESLNVVFRLSEGAVIKAARSWNSNEAMISFGTTGVGGGIGSVGRYIGITGGTIDGNGVARGIELGKIFGFREAYVRNVLIRNTSVGITITRGGNTNSADMDIDDVTIVGNGKQGSIGVFVDSYDNTLTNIKIYNTQIGLKFGGGGNIVRSIHVYNTSGLANTTGIWEASGIDYNTKENVKASGNFILHCRIVDCNVGVQFYGDTTIIDSCSATWTKAISGEKSAYKLNGDGMLRNTSLLNCRAEFYDGGNFFNSNGCWVAGNNFEAPMCKGGNTSNVGSMWNWTGVIPIS